MKKRILTLLICLVLILSVVPFSLMANTSLPNTLLSVGNRVVALDADAVSDALPQVFGTKEGDGLVWTNKTVAVKEDKFEVTLSALAQEYTSSVESEQINSTPADVVMILDISGSMRNNKLTLDNDSNATRTKAMVKAVNEAMEIIMNANPQNRVMIYTFHTDNSINTICDELLPLGHYTNPSWSGDSVWKNSSTNAASGKFFDYSTVTTGSGSNRTTSDKMSTAAGLLKDGSAVSSSITTSSGTCTQQGIITGVKALSDAISKEEHTIDRLPFVFLFTDGAPGAASKNWYSETPTDKNRTEHYNNGNSEVTALSVLTAAISKDRLSDAYTKHNGKETEVNWFNLGLTVGSSVQGNAFLNPITIKEGTNSSSTAISEYISSYTSGKYADYSQYADNYVYAEDNVVFADTGKELTDAFGTFAELIEESSKEVKLPIVNKNNASATAELVFTETLGEGMAVSEVTLSKEGVLISGTPSSSGEATVYTFEGLETTVTVSKNGKGQNVLTWNIPAKEVAMYTFADRSNTDNGQYIKTEPLRLVYDVKVDESEIPDNDRLYVSAFEKGENSQLEALSYAEFSVASDNPYYYNVITDEKGAFVSSTVKESAFETVNKDNNISGTVEYISKPAYNSGNNKSNITTLLGNNGTAFAVVQLEKKSSKAKVNANDLLSFTVTVTNLHNDKITGVVIKDTLPEGLEFVSLSANGVNVQSDNNVLTLTVDSLQAGQSLDIVYNVKVDPKAPTGTVYKNEAAVTSVENAKVSDPTPSVAEVMVENKFRVFYEWDGEIPSSVTKPQDNNVYITGDSYLVDAEYYSGYKIDTFDKYGNKNGYYSFSGWTDKQNGVMGFADVIIRGIWTFEDVEVKSNKVIYSWSGDIPDGVKLPKDDNSYVKGQSYRVDNEFYNNKRIESFDKYGNVNGYYEFSGWNDPQNSVMGDSDVTVIGKWKHYSQKTPDYKVVYDWGESFPEGEVLPEDDNRYVKNEPYEVDGKHTDKTVIDTFDKYGNKNGEWRFSGWNDSQNGIMGEKDVIVIGKWEYTSKKVPTNKVEYDWGESFPNGAVLPFDLNEYVKNEPYEVDDKHTNKTVVDTFDKYGNKNGEWRFSGWTDPQNGVMGEQNITIKGKWTYTAKTVETHKVLYEFKGDIPQNVTVPVDNGAYVKGEGYTVDTSFKTGDRVEVKDNFGNLSGVYTFLGWNDSQNGVMGDSDITIIGNWKYETVAVNEYIVTYYWGEAAPDSEDLPIDLNTYVTNQAYEIDTVYTSNTTVYSYDQKGNVTGVWRFSGWEDIGGGVMGTENVVIKGKWQFTKTQIPEHKVEFDDDTEIIENLDKIKVYPNGGVWLYAGNTYKDDESAVIIVEGNIEIQDPTRENFTYEGWEVLEEEGYVLEESWLLMGGSGNFFTFTVHV